MAVSQTRILVTKISGVNEDIDQEKTWGCDIM